jgi:hypothetical protein
MNTDRIKQIQQETAYPESVSVHQALLKVWNETEQEQLRIGTSGIIAEDVRWVVNDNAELGVKIGSKFYWLYKGRSLEYKDNKHDDGTPIKYRQVGKREFGECCHPLHLQRLRERYTDGVGWEECL